MRHEIKISDKNIVIDDRDALCPYKTEERKEPEEQEKKEDGRKVHKPKE